MIPWALIVREWKQERSIQALTLVLLMLHDDWKIFVFVVSNKCSVNNVWFCLAFTVIARKKIISRGNKHGLYFSVKLKKQLSFKSITSDNELAWLIL